jgi:adenosylmethionine-8-amino-7-oxononanoate aminotransferase
VRCARFLEDTIQVENTNTIAAFIAEGMIGGGGFIEPPPEWWPIVSEICRKYDVLLIADEVLSGFTRTGKMFCIDHWNIKPDIMTMAKGLSGAYLPFGAMAISDEVFNVLKGNIFMHGYTYSGHAIPAAASCASLDIYIKEKVVENVVKVGNHVKQRLEAEFRSLPCVGNISGMGLNYSVELVANKKTKNPISLDTKTEIIRKLRENGVFTRAIGRFGNRLHIGPPCTSTIEEVDKALDIVLSVVAEVKP